MAPTSSTDSSFKLNMDIKQELSVNGRIVAGGAEDDMLFSSILSRNAYVGKFSWSTAQSHGALIGQFLNGPGLCHWVSSTLICHSPMSWVSCAFAKWTGSLCWTIDIAASRFHTGRVRVTFIPEFTGTVDSLDVAAHSMVIDLKDTRTVRFTVPYAAATPWRKAGPHPFVDNGPTSAFGAYANGYIRLDVVDELASTAASTVDILVYASGGPDLQFNVPTMATANRCSLVAGPDLDAQCEMTEQALFGPALLPSTIDSVYYGERFDSIRSMIKTYSEYSTVSLTLGAESLLNYVTLHHARAPWPGLGIGSTGFWNRWTFYSWFAQGYFAARGGVRWKVTYVPIHVPTAPAALVTTGFSCVYAVAGSHPESTAPSTAATAYFATGTTPITTGLGPIQKSECAPPTQHFGPGEVLELECPMAMNYRFATAAWPNTYTATTLGALASGNDSSQFKATAVYTNSNTAAGIDYVMAHTQCAGAEDASFAWFLHAPILYIDGTRV